MALYLIKRLAAFLITLLASAIVVFLVLEVLPGDPASIMLGVNARADTLAALRAELGLDLPAWLRFIPNPEIDHTWAQSRSPMDMIFQGCWVSWFHAKQQ
jgi:hypothetical protein